MHRSEERRVGKERKYRHTRCLSDWSSDVCSSDLLGVRCVRCALGVPTSGVLLMKTCISMSCQSLAMHSKRTSVTKSTLSNSILTTTTTHTITKRFQYNAQIGRASCREREKI